MGFGQARHELDALAVMRIEAIEMVADLDGQRAGRFPAIDHRGMGRDLVEQGGQFQIGHHGAGLAGQARGAPDGVAHAGLGLVPDGGAHEGDARRVRNVRDRRSGLCSRKRWRVLCQRAFEKMMIGPRSSMRQTSQTTMAT